MKFSRYWIIEYRYLGVPATGHSENDNCQPAGRVAILQRLNAAVASVLSLHDARQRITVIGAEGLDERAGQFEGMLKAGYGATQNLVAQTGLNVDRPARNR